MILNGKRPCRCGRLQVAVFRILSGFYCCVVYNSFCEVVSDQLRPDLLFYKFRFIRMETAKANSVLELAERCFNSPYAGINLYYGKVTINSIVRRFL